MGIVVGLLLSAVFKSENTFGSVYNQVMTYFNEGITVGGNSQFVVSSTGAVTSGAITATGALTASGDATISGGTLNITTANTATSTIVAGCWEFYATSTATAHKFQASTTPGVMYSQYGTCPRL